MSKALQGKCLKKSVEKVGVVFFSAASMPGILSIHRYLRQRQSHISVYPATRIFVPFLLSQGCAEDWYYFLDMCFHLGFSIYFLGAIL